jgi:hypothetical protein
MLYQGMARKDVTQESHNRHFRRSGTFCQALHNQSPFSWQRSLGIDAAPHANDGRAWRATQGSDEVVI